MAREDWPMIGLWLATIVLLVAMAWEPWRQTRGRSTIDLSNEVEGRPVPPFQIFLLPALLTAAPFVAPLIRHAASEVPGFVSPWRHPHMLWPVGLLPLGGFVAVQLVMRRQFLSAARRRREERARVLEVLAGAERKSVRRPR